MRGNLHDDCEGAVLGAGPYGLAVAAHLRAAEINTRVFGRALSFWRENMPKGMRLRSPWIATHIADPDNRFSLDAFARRVALTPREQLPLEQFVQYGEWFQAQVAPDLDTRIVKRVESAGPGFRLCLDDDQTVHARRVVVAMGLARQEWRPPPFDGIDSALVSHSCEHAALDKWSGKRVAVIGRGQSACESGASRLRPRLAAVAARAAASPLRCRAVPVELAQRAARAGASIAGRAARIDRSAQLAGCRVALDHAGLCWRTAARRPRAARREGRGRPCCDRAR
jgi:cation diffusion facilitator CzcD-associated flavoprotein CzcO